MSSSTRLATQEECEAEETSELPGRPAAMRSLSNKSNKDNLAGGKVPANRARFGAHYPSTQGAGLRLESVNTQ
jgi:hypothetical protein